MPRSDELYQQLRAFEGRRVGRPTPAREPVNRPMINHWCDALDDRNPIYTDPEFAARTRHGGIVAPPTMLQAWTMRGLRPPPRPADEPPGPQAGLFALLDGAGFSSVVAVNCSQEYRRYLRPGDQIDVTTEIESVSPEKQTALGPGHFITQRMIYRDQAGEEIANMRWRLLKFRPGSGGGAPAKPAPAAGRPRPRITPDTRFFWQGLERGVLLVQRCRECRELRHPPGPMCPTCRSPEWEAAELGGRGRVYSWVVAHLPRIPPFDTRNVIALVELEEGVRMVSNLVGLDGADVRIGMAVECEIAEVEEGYPLPLFRPSGGA